MKLADGKRASVEGQGCGTVTCYDENDQSREVSLSVALYTPSLSMNLLSVPQLVKKRAVVTFDANGCRISNGKDTIAFATLIDFILNNFLTFGFRIRFCRN